MDRWLNFAFERDENHEKPPKVNIKTVTIFVHYFWRMWTSAATVESMTSYDAKVYLKRMRLEYGYKTLIDDDVIMVGGSEDSDESDNASEFQDAPTDTVFSPSRHDSTSVIFKMESLPASPLPFSIPKTMPRKRRRPSLDDAEKSPRSHLPTPARAKKKPKIEPAEGGICRAKKRKRLDPLPDLEEGKSAKRAKFKTPPTPITPPRTRHVKINAPVAFATTAVAFPIAQAPLPDVESGEQLLPSLTPTPPGVVEHAPCETDVPPCDDVLLPFKTEPASSSSHQTELQCGVSDIKDLAPATALPASDSSSALVQCHSTTAVPAGRASTTKIIDSLLHDINAEQKPSLRVSQSVVPDISAHTLRRLLMALKSDCEPPTDRPKYERLPPIWAMVRYRLYSDR